MLLHVDDAKPKKRSFAPRGKAFSKGEDNRRWRGGRTLPAPVYPAGTPIYAVFRSYTEDAARLCAVIMRDPLEQTDMRLRAASIILQRGWGDAPKALITNALSPNARAGELTEADIVAMIQGKQEPAAIDVQAEPSTQEESPPPIEGD